MLDMKIEFQTSLSQTSLISHRVVIQQLALCRPESHLGYRMFVQSVEIKQMSGDCWGHHTSKDIVRLVWDVMALSRVNCSAIDLKFPLLTVIPSDFFVLVGHSIHWTQQRLSQSGHCQSRFSNPPVDASVERIRHLRPQAKVITRISCDPRKLHCQRVISRL